MTIILVLLSLKFILIECNSSSQSHRRRYYHDRRRLKRRRDDNDDDTISDFSSYSNYDDDTYEEDENDRVEELVSILEKIDKEEEYKKRRRRRKGQTIRRRRRSSIKTGRRKTKSTIKKETEEKRKLTVKPTTERKGEDSVNIQRMDASTSSTLGVRMNENAVTFREQSGVESNNPYQQQQKQQQGGNRQNMQQPGSTLPGQKYNAKISMTTTTAIQQRQQTATMTPPRVMTPSSSPMIKSQEELQQQRQTTSNAKKRNHRTAMLAYTTPWVIQLLQRRPRDSLFAVPRDFLADGFNLVYLSSIIEEIGGADNDASFSLYKAALRLILTSTEEDLQNMVIPSLVQLAAEKLYSLVHARYIISPHGLNTAHQLLTYDSEVFGKCPRPSCRGMPLLPHGVDYSDGRSSSAKRYCYGCGQAWEQWDSKADGSAWGPSFCHLYLLTFGKSKLTTVQRNNNKYGNDDSSNTVENGDDSSTSNVDVDGGGKITLPQNPNTIPTVFGFRVHKAALQRMYEDDPI